MKIRKSLVSFWLVVFFTFELLSMVRGYQKIHSNSLPVIVRSSAHSLQRNRFQTKLQSFGDPDKSTESILYRKWQQFTRIYDYFLFPEEMDCPGLTFPSPIEWAPWMETIWFGNYYEYRSAWFHDVMYSNNREGKEGALLVPLPVTPTAKSRSPPISRLTNYPISLDLALIYQRYNKFNQQSYSISNLTYFNLFGTESIRIGRYKVPQTPELLLCVTDPLTFSDMKRYFTSFSILKWFKSRFIQQKRKRQWLLSFAPVSPAPSSSPSVGRQQQPQQDVNYFSKMVYLLEYYKMIEYLTLYPPTGSATATAAAAIQKLNYLQKLTTMILTEKLDAFDEKLTEFTLQTARQHHFPTQSIPILSNSLPKADIYLLLPQHPYEQYSIPVEQIQQSLQNKADGILDSWVNNSTPIIDQSDTVSNSEETESEKISQSIVALPLHHHSAVDGFVVPIMTANSQYFMETLFQSIIQLLSNQYNVFDPSDWEVIIGGDQRLFNSYAIEIAVRIFLANQLTNVQIAKQSLYTVSLAKQDYALRQSPVQASSSSNKEKTSRSSSARYSLSVILSGNLATSGIGGNFGVQLLLYDSSQRRVLSWSLSDHFQLLSIFESLAEVKILPNTFNSECLNYFNYPMSSSLFSSPSSLQSITSLSYHKYTLSIHLTALQNSYSSYPISLLWRIKQFLQERNIILIIDGSYGVAKQLLTGSSLSEKIGLNLNDNYVNNDFVDEKSRLVNTDQPYPLLDPGRNLYSAIYREKSVAIEETVIGELFQINSSTAFANQLIDDEKSSFADCPDIGFSISADGSDCQILLPGLVLPRRQFPLIIADQEINDGITVMIGALSALAEYYGNHPQEKIHQDKIYQLLTSNQTRDIQ